MGETAEQRPMACEAGNMKTSIKKQYRMEEKKEKFLDALAQGRGIISTACDATGIGRSTYYRWYNADPAFRERVDEVTETQVDFVESKLIQAIDRGDITATIFYLKTKGKKRGYSEKAQPKAPDPLPVATTLPPPAPSEEDGRKIASRVKSKKAYIVKLLKEQGKYTAELTYQVDITAKLLVRADILGDEIMAGGHRAVNVEYSREGNARKTIDPKEKLYIELLEKGQKALRALGMNTESKERKADSDEFNDFLAAVKPEDDE